MDKQSSVSAAEQQDGRRDDQTKCKICSGVAVRFASATVLRKYVADYHHCTVCGFMWVDNPNWLAEAYSDAIAKLDVGIIARNAENSWVTSAIIKLLFADGETFLDYGAGHGIFVRAMRDRGFPFKWSDRYAANLFARGFEHQGDCKYDLVTAFEVLEHLVDPVSEISRIMQFSDSFLATTVLLPEPPPKPEQWWYFALSTGQHVSFYTRYSLQVVASIYGRYLVSNGFYHLFTTRRVKDLSFRAATNVRLVRALNRLFRRSSLLDHDFKMFA